MTQQKKARSKEDYLSLVYGKVPPNNIDAEKKVLGYMMMYPKNVAEVRSILDGEEFYKEEHRIIAKAIFEISNYGLPDIVLVAQKLRELEELEKVGGAYYLTKLEDALVGGEFVDIKPTCLIVKETFLKRELIRISGEIISDSYDASVSVFSALHTTQVQLDGISTMLEGLQVKNNSSIAYSVLETFQSSVQKARAGVVDENAVYTGITEWDKVNGALFPGLYIVAGRPGMGKGVHMTELICRMGKTYQVGVINGEMTDEQLMTRIACNLKSIDNQLFKKDKRFIKDEELDLLQEGLEEALQLKLHIENNRRMDKIKNRIKMWVKQLGVKVVLADFLTLFKAPPTEKKYMTKTDEVDYCLGVFTDLCKELKIPIILYVQMNREILGRHGIKEPNLADLKQSGSIEELAYQVSFLHRPEYYDQTATQDENGEDCRGLLYQIIAKHRDGKLDRLKLRANLACSQITEWDSTTFLPLEQKDIQF